MIAEQAGLSTGPDCHMIVMVGCSSWLSSIALTIFLIQSPFSDGQQIEGLEIVNPFIQISSPDEQ